MSSEGKSQVRRRKRDQTERRDKGKNEKEKRRKSKREAEEVARFRSIEGKEGTTLLETGLQHGQGQSDELARG